MFYNIFVGETDMQAMFDNVLQVYIQYFVKASTIYSHLLLAEKLRIFANQTWLTCLLQARCW